MLSTPATPHPSGLSLQTVVHLRRADVVHLDWSVPAWDALAKEPANRGFVRHGGVTRAIDNVGPGLKPPYSNHADAFVALRGNAPRSLLAWGTRNTFQNLGLPGWHRQRSPKLLARPDEPWRLWTYHALCKRRDGAIALNCVRFEAAPSGDVAIVPDDGPATDIEWAVTGQPLLWDGVVPSLPELAASTYDLRHIWRLRWEDWQNCHADQVIHAEMMAAFLEHLSAPAKNRAAALSALAAAQALPVTTGYLHSSVGLNAAGDLVLLMKTASVLELGQTHANLGTRRAILLDNGGSVGAAYWSRHEWQKTGWVGLRDRPVFLGNGSYFRPRGHAVLIAELARDLPEGPSAEV